MGIEFLSSPFPRNQEEGCSFAPIIFNRSVAPLYPRKASIAVAECRLVRIQKSFRVGHRGNARIGIISSVLPNEDSSTGDDAFRIRLIGPQVNHVATVAKPLIEDSRREIFIQPELEIYMRIEGAIWFSQ